MTIHCNRTLVYLHYKGVDLLVFDHRTILFFRNEANSPITVLTQYSFTINTDI